MTNSARSPKRRAYILIIVLGMTAVVTSLGWAYVSANSTVVSESVNRYRSARARYLAGSGVNLAMHYLLYPPTGVPNGDYWRGAAAIAIDSSADYTDVAVTKHATDARQYKVRAIGTALDPDGSVRGRRTVNASVLVPPDRKWRIPYAYLARSNVAISSRARIFGDVHANGSLWGWGWCQSKVSATGTAMWFGSGPPASVTSGAAAFTAPTGDLAKHQTYTIKGRTYSAYVYAGADMTSSSASTLNATDMSTTNPGRIIYKNGDLTIKANVNLSGTLVINGKLRIDGDGFVLTPLADYPAVVTSNDIQFSADGRTAAINGAVLCGNKLSDGGRKNNTLNISGCAVVLNGFDISDSSNTIDFTWDAARSTFWDVEYLSAPWPITILDWQES